MSAIISQVIPKNEGLPPNDRSEEQEGFKSRDYAIFCDVLIPNSSLNPTPRIALFVGHGGRHSDRHGGGQGGLAGP